MIGCARKAFSMANWDASLVCPAIPAQATEVEKQALSLAGAQVRALSAMEASLRSLRRMMLFLVVLVIIGLVFSVVAGIVQFVDAAQESRRLL